MDDVAKAVSIIHDHEGFIRLNPLVTEFEHTSTQNTPFPLPDEGPLPPPPENQDEVWKTYQIIDEIPRLGGFWKQRIWYTTGLCNVENGIKGVTDPGVGVNIAGDWLVEKDADGKLMLTETATVTCNVILMPLIKFTLHSSHDEMHEKIAEMIRQKAGPS